MSPVEFPWENETVETAVMGGLDGLVKRWFSSKTFFWWIFRVFPSRWCSSRTLFLTGTCTAWVFVWNVLAVASPAKERLRQKLSKFEVKSSAVSLWGWGSSLSAMLERLMGTLQPVDGTSAKRCKRRCSKKWCLPLQLYTPTASLTKENSNWSGVGSN